MYVNRGWVPKESKIASCRRAGQLEGLVEVEAVVRQGEKGAWYMPPTSGADRTMTWLDLEQISKSSDGAAGDAVTPQPLLFDAVTTASVHEPVTSGEGPEP